MKITDAHAHFTFDQFDKDLDKVVKKMKKAGVWRVINNGVHLEDNKKVLTLSENHDIFLSALGMYPAHIVDSTDKQIQEVFDFIQKNKSKIVAIGEVGLDHYHSTNKKDWAKQEKYFRQIIDIANTLNKPLVVHSRKAEHEIYEPLKEAKVPVIVHCFFGPAQALQIGIDRGYYFSVNCSVLRNKNHRKVAKRVPLNRLLTETDAPLLAPEPRTRNDSSNISLVLAKVAELRGESQSKIEKAILNNFKRLFVK